MANLNYNLIASDGFLPSPDEVFHQPGSLSPEATLTTPQLIKTQVPNLSDSAINPAFYFGNYSSSTSWWSFYFYNSSSQQWESGSFNNHTLGNYLSIYVGFDQHKKYYICLSKTDEEKVPSLPNGGFYYKLSEVPTKGSFSTYATVTGPGGASYIPVVLPAISRLNGDLYYFHMLGLHTSAGVDYLYLSGDLIKIGDPITNPTGRRVSTYIKLLSPGEKPPSLEERVGALEGEVSNINNEIQLLQGSMENVQAKLDTILSATSKFFVSR